MLEAKTIITVSTLNGKKAKERKFNEIFYII